MCYCTLNDNFDLTSSIVIYSIIIYLSTVYIIFYLSIYLSVYTSISPFNYLCIYTSINSSSICLSIHLYIHIYIHPIIYHYLYMYLSFKPSIYISIYLYIYLSYLSIISIMILPSFSILITQGYILKSDINITITASNCYCR
jgi:hypothetical protein